MRSFENAAYCLESCRGAYAELCYRAIEWAPKEGESGRERPGSPSLKKGRAEAGLYRKAGTACRAPTKGGSSNVPTGSR